MTLRVATVVALGLTFGLGALSTLLFAAAFQFRLDWLFDPAQVVASGPVSAVLFRWAALTDLFSYYLPTAVVAIALWVALRGRSLLVASAATVAALGYALAGGAGAAVLATAGASLIERYAAGGPAQAGVAEAFRVLVDVVFRGIWQMLDAVLAGAWWLGIGWLLRADHPELARLTLTLGGLFVGSAGLNVLGLGLVRDVTLGGLFILWAAWSAWLAVLVWRRTPPFDALDARAAAGVTFRLTS